jgi:hypothetical protein
MRLIWKQANSEASEFNNYKKESFNPLKFIIMQTVTPWSATTQEDIENSELLLERKILDYTY